MHIEPECLHADGGDVMFGLRRQLDIGLLEEIEIVWRRLPRFGLPRFAECDLREDARQLVTHHPATLGVEVDSPRRSVINEDHLEGFAPGTTAQLPRFVIAENLVLVVSGVGEKPVVTVVALLVLDLTRRAAAVAGAVIVSDARAKLRPCRVGRSEILLREPVALLPRGAPQSFDVIENPCGAEYAGMIEITGERTLVRVAERGEFFR